MNRKYQNIENIRNKVLDDLNLTIDYADFQSIRELEKFFIHTTKKCTPLGIYNTFKEAFLEILENE